ncbi:MAG TPA: aldehyde dehydrogenase family protein [Polyangiales bacterium]|jgi:acyl-CoA reductase-like NAD-dependent aldehyde dehydrogenase
MQVHRQEVAMSDYTMSIDGGQVRGTNSFGVVNPATEEVFAEAPACSEAELNAAVAAAKRAFPSWRRDETARRQWLRQAGERLKEDAEKIARTLTLEQGKPLAMALGEVTTAAKQLMAAAEMPIPNEITRDDERNRIEISYRPLGVVAAITPWNFPILIATAKVAPALLAGNTMVLKPSPFTPLSTLQYGAVLNQVLPQGVLNVISGGNELGALLGAHPDVRKISFTGSVSTGKKVAHTAADDLKRITLELGGNDPAIVLDDADVQAIAPRLFWSAFLNSGQVCLAVKRVYVPEALLSPLTAALSQLAKTVKVGDGLAPDTQLGPINNAPQLERVIDLVDDAKRHGATLHAGGERLGRKGYFYAPTLLSNVDDDVAIVAEEQFGPVLPLLPYRDLDDAIARANDTNFGLGASVWSSNLARADEVAKQIDAGTVWINSHVALTPLAPFTGAKWSGIGEASGRWGLAAFLQKHVINTQR